MQHNLARNEFVYACINKRHSSAPGSGKGVEEPAIVTPDLNYELEGEREDDVRR